MIARLLSYSIDGDRTRAGQPLVDAFAVAAQAPEVMAVGVNCCAPADVPKAITVAREITGKPVIVYPNSGEGWDARARRWTGGARFSPKEARRWVVAGARIVGGCCRVGPDAIAHLADSVRHRAETSTGPPDPAPRP
jgi:homocysteine S-methyltransferase